MLLFIIIMACTSEDSAPADTAPPSATGDGSSCPPGPLLAMDWVDHDPEQQWYSGTRLVVTPGVSRIRGASTDGSRGSLCEGWG